MEPNKLKSRLNIAVLGTGVSGLSAAWLLSRSHDVTVFEQGAYAGGHSNTVDVRAPGGPIAVDTGFIVYNEPAYPNLTALFDHLQVDTKPPEMTFAVSLDETARSNMRATTSPPSSPRRKISSAVASGRCCST